MVRVFGSSWTRWTTIRWSRQESILDHYRPAITVTLRDMKGGEEMSISFDGDAPSGAPGGDLPSGMPGGGSGK